MLHSAEDSTGKRTNWTIKDGPGGAMESRAETVKQYNNSEKEEEKSEIS